ncbi:flagellar export chaperone FlgN [Pantoea sp. 1.19]|uniref:flagellar export chaperone FlgN n=1 Tax=Pantoea sp. 1.19 TaxID=1925589 RepID=UPI000948FB41|nr:flagellar export chaperone FlgN [Pantoea sp. 1.19]
MTAEQSLCLTAPYPGRGAAAARWQAIRTATAALRDINVHNGLLLEQQMAHNQASLALLRPHQSQHFYGPNGLAVNTPPPSRKRDGGGAFLPHCTVRRAKSRGRKPSPASVRK